MTPKRQKVLIIKVGHSETLDHEVGNATSYGDVLRTTVLLHPYKNDNVTWLVDENAYPILRHNPLIDRILIYNLSTVLQLQSEHFDTVINLEKVPGLCALADQITAWRRYGFRFDVKAGEAEAYDGTQNALSLCQDELKKKIHNRYWQEHLFEMVGAKWKGEEYVFNYKGSESEQFDVGFNFMIGTKWPTKAWPMKNWKALESMLKRNHTVSWQQGLENMDKYFEWIDSCRLIVTNDSFGLHLAVAMEKKVVALFGTTNPRETYLYGHGTSLTNNNCDCPHMPCYLPQCKYKGEPCIADITPETVFSEISHLLSDHGNKESKINRQVEYISIGACNE